MGLDRITLAFDTSGPHVAAALIRGADTVLLAHGSALPRGQAEVLFPQCNAMLNMAELSWANVSAIAVGIGPGNFTGIRIAVAAARGLALGLGVPAVGVSGFEVLVAQSGRQDAAAPALFTIAAPRGQVYVQPFALGLALGPARLIDISDDLSALGQLDGVYGHAALSLGDRLGVSGTEFSTPTTDEQIADIAVRIGYIAARKLQAGVVVDPPAPMYLRPADAAAPSDPPVKVMM